eukprot:583829-Amphidinium_carterae.1
MQRNAAGLLGTQSILSGKGAMQHMMPLSRSASFRCMIALEGGHQLDKCWQWSQKIMRNSSSVRNQARKT